MFDMQWTAILQWAVFKEYIFLNSIMKRFIFNITQNIYISCDVELLDNDSIHDLELLSFVFYTKIK